MQPVGTLPTQQERPEVNLHGPQMIRNNYGGYVYEVTDLKKVERFAIMGCEGGSYAVMEEKLAKENIQALTRLIATNKGKEAVDSLRKISVERRNVKQNPLLYALAVCARSNDLETKTAAYHALNDMLRIPTHLFMFIKYCEQESEPNTGWGRAHKTAIQQWYKQFENKPDRLAMLVTKYKHREGWTHKDVLRLAHPIPKNPVFGYILRYVTRGLQEADNYYMRGVSEAGRDPEVERIARVLKAYDDAMRCTNADQLCSMIVEYKLSWEHLPTNMLTDKKVWQTLLRNMPIEALIRNLGRMTKLGVFPENSEEEDVVLKKIRDINKEVEPREDDDGDTPRRKNLIHPFKVLVGLVTYKHGKGDKGSLSWIPNTRIIDALDNAFYQAFEHVEPTGKKFFLAVDVSGSMSQPAIGSRISTLSEMFIQQKDLHVRIETPTARSAGGVSILTSRSFYWMNNEDKVDIRLTHRIATLTINVYGIKSQIRCNIFTSAVTCATAAAAMLMTVVRTESKYFIKGFSHKLVDLEILPKDDLTTVMRKTSDRNFGATDCALPMIHAQEMKDKDVDVFIVYTDNETWFGKIHPAEALRQYRMYSENSAVKLIVCGMCANKFSIADPSDGGMLDIAGFDSAAPQLISDFATETK